MTRMTPGCVCGCADDGRCRHASVSDTWPTVHELPGSVDSLVCAYRIRMCSDKSPAIDFYLDAATGTTVTLAALYNLGVLHGQHELITVDFTGVGVLDPKIWEPVTNDSQLAILCPAIERQLNHMRSALWSIYVTSVYTASVVYRVRDSEAVLRWKSQTPNHWMWMNHRRHQLWLAASDIIFIRDVPVEGLVSSTGDHIIPTSWGNHQRVRWCQVSPYVDSSPGDHHGILWGPVRNAGHRDAAKCEFAALFASCYGIDCDSLLNALSDETVFRSIMHHSWS
jgi:hypothetical protein